MEPSNQANTGHIIHWHFCFLRVVCMIVILCSVTAENLSPSATLIWGPGLHSGFVAPVRYFFIQPVDESGQWMTSNISGADLMLNLSTDDGRKVRAKTQLLKRTDGTYIVLYRLFEIIPHDKSLVISMTINEEHLGNSPYELKGPLYKESCNCPVETEKWTDNWNCPLNNSQISLDLSHFSEIDMDKIMQIANKRFNNPGAQSLCNYVIKNNKVYRKCYGQHVGFKMFVDNMLLSILRKTHLPDMEFLSNLGDWPLENGRNKNELLPIFSWCGSDDSYDIVMPTYDLTESTLKALDRVMLDMLSVQGNTGPPWSEKIDKAFFRGRDSRKERLLLAELSQKNPHLIDAGITNYFFFEKNETKYGPKAQHISFFEFFKYRYIINVDGTVAAYRLPYLLAGDSLVLKQDSEYYEYFYKELSPWVHFVPVAKDLSNLFERINWAQKNPEKVQKIISNAQKFTMDALLPRNIFCYYVTLFQEYSKKLKSQVKIREDMEFVPQPEDAQKCGCRNGALSLKDEL